MPKHWDRAENLAMEHMIPRRELLLATLASPFGAGLSRPASRNVRAFRLVEAAGLRRFGYPVQAVVPDAVEGRNFRLLRDGRAIPAQFRAVEVASGHRELYLDFTASPEPLETQRYEVLFGPDVESGPEPKTGLKVEERDGRFSIAQSSALTFEFAKRPGGFLETVGGPRLGYLREGSGGLTIFEKNANSGRPVEAKREPSAARARVTREGPISVGLRSEWTGPSGQASTLDLTVPNSKSWVQVTWTVVDPDRRVSGLGLDLNLKIEGSPTLVDFGAGSTIYGQIKGPQRMDLAASRGQKAPEGWVVRQGEGEKPAIFAASTPGSPRLAEGWAHIMDARRCTALAVADFGRNGYLDRITVEADGHLSLVRDFPDSAAASKALAFWLHFVPMPVQVGAATSPQAILDPLRVDWDR
jgi:hypothetical protein